MSLVHIFLIRHGETVDNVAGLYAGVRDSALTSHGILQIRRLADHLAAHPSLTKTAEDKRKDGLGEASSEPEDPSRISIFSSDLVRAVKTAEAISNTLHHRSDGTSFPVVQLKDLREKNFGSGEGTRFGVARKAGAIKSEDHVGAETREEMRTRADRFIDEHLLTLFPNRNGTTRSVIVVAHGLILSSLFHAICEKVKQSRKDSSGSGLVPKATGISFDPSGKPRLPSWSNTGYLEAEIAYKLPPLKPDPRRAPLTLSLREINCTSHLAGLRKTRGGIGSAKFDDKQKSISSFFGKSPVNPSSPSQKRKASDDDDDAGLSKQQKS